MASIFEDFNITALTKGDGVLRCYETVPAGPDGVREGLKSGCETFEDWSTRGIGDLGSLQVGEMN